MDKQTTQHIDQHIAGLLAPVAGPVKAGGRWYEAWATIEPAPPWYLQSWWRMLNPFRSRWWWEVEYRVFEVELSSGHVTEVDLVTAAYDEGGSGGSFTLRGAMLAGAVGAERVLDEVIEEELHH